MALLSILSTSGHTVLEYDKTDEDQVREVNEQFDKMAKNGYLGFADGALTPVFDPEAEHITMSPVIAGG